MQSNPFPAAFVNNQCTLRVIPITLPGGSAWVEWKMDLLTEHHRIGEMTIAMNDVLTVALSSKSAVTAFVLVQCCCWCVSKKRL